MSWTNMLRTAQEFAIKNSPTILTTIGVVGTLTTAVLTGKAAYSSACRIRNINDDMIAAGGDFLTPKEVATAVWKEFIPPAVIGAITFAAIIGANRIGTRRAAALAAAFTMSEKMAEEYRQKVVEHMGAQKEEMVRSDVARDRIGRTDGVETLILGEGEIIFYDSWSDRAFTSTRQRVEDAVNQINYQINQAWAASLTEFFDLLGLKATGVSDSFGWNTDELLDVNYTSCLLPDGRPACEIRYNTQPFQNYNKIGL